MKRPLVLRWIAAQEFEDSIAWYENKREGLGREFRAAIEENFQRIADNPRRFPKVRGEVRRLVVLRRFLFVVHFVIEAKQIVVLSVFHTSRNPGQLKYRR
jgi:toxin ParE1/3/4